MEGHVWYIEDGIDVEKNKIDAENDQIDMLTVKLMFREII